MGYDAVIQRHYEDLNNLSLLLRNYIEIYRLLISSTVDLHATSVVKKNELKHALERVDNVGEVIDDLLRTIKKCEGSYTKYCTLRNEVILANTEKESILTEIHDDLSYHN